AEMEDFFNGGSKDQDDSIVKSKFMPSPAKNTPGDLQNELKTNIKEAQTIDDYLRISQQIVSIITIAKESEHYTKFLSSIIRDCTCGMSAEDIKSITANMSAKASKKYKKQKPVIKYPKRNLNIENLYD
ncbi:hypothetical protein, partial [Salmonella sp. s54836]|uniref:hypothetical protein n=1 Tax=Salmonella sp. s54836 TaxID=3159673 RepID=UPI0039808E44